MFFRLAILILSVAIEIFSLNIITIQRLILFLASKNQKMYLIRFGMQNWH